LPYRQQEWTGTAAQSWPVPTHVPVSSKPPENLTATVLGGVRLTSAGYFVTQVLTFASYLVLARVASPSDFGEFAAGSIFIGFGVVFAESGMLAALIHRRDRLDEAASTAVVATVAAGVGMGVVGVAVSPLIGLFFHSATIGSVAAVMPGYLVLRQAVIVPDALMQRRFSFLRRIIIEPVAALTFGATAITACSHGMRVWGLVVGWYAMGTSQLILSWALARWKPDFTAVSFGMWRDLVRYGRHVVAAEFVRRATDDLSTVLIGRFAGVAALGQFQYALRVAARPLDALVSTTSHVLYPAFARISDDPPRFRSAVVRSLRWMSVLALPASLLLFAFGEPLVVLAFGERWRDAGNALTAMCLFPAGHSFDSLGSEVFKAAGRPNLLFRMHSIGLLLTAVFMAALLPFGINGVAAAISLRSVGVAAYALYAIGAVIKAPRRDLLAELWPPTISALVAAVVVVPVEHFVVHPDGALTLVALAVLGAEMCLALVVYVAALRIVAPRTGMTILHGVRRAPLLLFRKHRRDVPADADSRPPVATTSRQI
jgi:O-antigen/teichoic acid export membrane protein